MSIRDVSCIPGVLGAQGMPKGPSESSASICLVHAPFVLTRAKKSVHWAASLAQDTVGDRYQGPG